MLVRFTREAYKGKKEALAGLKSVHWLEADISFDTFLDLYRHGHTAVVSSKEESSILVLDLDGRPKAGEKAQGMTQAEASLVHSEKFLEDVKELLGARAIVRCDSASRTFYKQKLLINLDYKRDIRENTDFAYRALRLRFEKAFGIQCDPRMDSWTQLTFGSHIAEGKYLPETEAAIRHGRPSSQPRKAEKGAPAEASQGGTRHHTVPTDMASLNYKYGKRAREGLRLEFSFYRHSKEGRRGISIPAGTRHASVPMVVQAIVYYAHYCNFYYGGTGAGLFTEADAEFTVFSRIVHHFENGAQFLSEERRYIAAKIHEEWASIEALTHEHGAEDGINAYAANRGQFRKHKVLDGYTPRDVEFAQFFHAHCDQIKERLSISRDAAIDFIDGVLIPAYQRLYSGDHDSPSLHKKFMAACYRIRLFAGCGCKWASIIEAAPKNEMGGPTLPRQYQKTPALRAYLKDNGIKNWSWR